VILKDLCIFLALASVINAVLAYIFVRYFHWGVAGAGISTLIAQGISAFLVVYVLVKTEEDYGLNYHDIRFDVPILKRIIAIGLPTGFQQSITSLSNVVVQSYVNAFGSSVVAGYSSAIRIDGFVNLPLQSFNMTVTTFVGQNMGARQYHRVKKGAKITMIMASIVIAILAIVLYFLGTDFIKSFVGDVKNNGNVITAGRSMQLAFIPFYIVLPIVQTINGVLRGAGRSTIPMYIMIFNFVILRQIYLMIATLLSNDIIIVFLGWPITWITCCIMFIIYYRKAKWLPKEDGELY
jgi:putative MATE family efflux protein